MPRQTETLGNIVAGKLTLVERDRFAGSLHTLPDGPVTVTVKSVGKRRSSKANRYYRGVVVPLIAQAMADAWGEEVDDDEAHEFLKIRFNLRTIEAEKTTIELAGSTTRLTTDEFAVYVDKCRHWACQFFNINIPDPEKFTTEQPA